MRQHIQQPEYMKIPPDSIFKFRNALPTDDCVFPELSKHRTCTDKIYLIIFVGYMISLTVFFAAMFCMTDLKKYFYENDTCGVNSKFSKNVTDCKSSDCTNYTITFYTENGSQCIKAEECKGNDRAMIFGRCLSKKIKKYSFELQHYNIIRSSHCFIVAITMVLVLIVVIYVSFRLIPKITLYTVIFGGIGVMGTATVICWYMYLGRKLEIFLFHSLITLIYFSWSVILQIFFKNKFHLVIRLFAEASKMIFKAPILFLQPAITLGFVALFNGTLFYTGIIMYYHNAKSDSTFDKVRFFYFFFTAFATYWLYAFANGCQCMIVAYIVVMHFFTREESPSIRFAYLKSLRMLLYHCGSVAAGALVITVLRGLLPLTNCLRKCKVSSRCSGALHEASVYMTKKAYIMTAIHGRSIYPSGRRVARLSWLFLCDIISIDYLACATMHVISFLFILCAAAIFFAMITPLELEFPMPTILLSMVLTGHITFFYVSLMNVVIETMVVCFCEDRLLNDGTRYQPYFMPVNFFQLMVEALDVTYSETSRSRQ